MQYQTTCNEHVVLAVAGSGNIQARLSGKEVSDFGPQSDWQRNPERQLEICAASILEGPFVRASGKWIWRSRN